METQNTAGLEPSLFIHFPTVHAIQLHAREGGLKQYQTEQLINELRLEKADKKRVTVISLIQREIDRRLKDLKGAPLASEMREYFAEFFEHFKGLDHIDYRDPEELQQDMQARFQREFSLDDVTRSLEMSADETADGAFRINREDFYIPGKEVA